MRLFMNPSIRVKVFLRDDMLEQMVGSGKGFTALTHITARQADTSAMVEELVLAMLIKRITDEKLKLCKS